MAFRQLSNNRWVAIFCGVPADRVPELFVRETVGAMLSFPSNGQGLSLVDVETGS